MANASNVENVAIGLKTVRNRMQDLQIALDFVLWQIETLANQREKSVIFKLDSGASDHLIKAKWCFAELANLGNPIEINVAKDDQGLLAKQAGKNNW